MMERNPFTLKDYPLDYMNGLFKFLGMKGKTMAKPKVLPECKPIGMPMANPAAPKPRTGFPSKPFKAPKKPKGK